MNVMEPFVLDRDVVLVACTELTDDLRGRIAFDDGDVALTRRHGRTLSQVIDGETAALLALFREPRTIVDAVVEHSRTGGGDPQRRLDELLPHLGTLVEDGVLVPAGSDDRRDREPRYESGAIVAGWKIVRCVSLGPDTEVYQLRRGDEVAALKIGGIETESAIPRHLDGAAVVPRLIDAGTHEAQPYIIVDWVPAAPPDANGFVEDVLRSLAPGGEAFAACYPTPSRTSAKSGCAGAAIALLRIGAARGDRALLALADAWISRAYALLDDEERSWYSIEPGVHAAAAMIAAANRNAPSQNRAIAAFVDAAQRPCSSIDLTQGRCGSLLAAAMLLAIGDDPPLRAFGSGTLRAIWKELDAAPPIAGGPADAYLGMAHGWAGILYASLRWCAASGDALPPRLVGRLHEHAALKTHRGRGVYWRLRAGGPDDDMLSGWCHGSAGQLFLYTLADRLLGGEEWLRLAELCAWNNWDEPRGRTTLCCGTAGRAYALLNYYNRVGDDAWLRRARELANHAASNAAATAQVPHSLWKGELGAAVLLADLSSPEAARMPFFE